MQILVDLSLQQNLLKYLSLTQSPQNWNTYELNHQGESSTTVKFSLPLDLVFIGCTCLLNHISRHREKNKVHIIRFRIQGSAWEARTLTFSCSQLLLYKTPRHFLLKITVILKNVADYFYLSLALFIG